MTTNSTLSRTLFLIPFLFATVLCLPAGGQELKDDFNDNKINSCLWQPFQTGTGSSVTETNQRLEITHAADAHGNLFGAGYGSVFKLHGDFDMQVDYTLLDWPFASGIRVGLGIPDTPMGSAAERTSFGTSADFGGEPREVYLTHFEDGVQGITATSDMSGTLRLVRSGSTLTGYYWDGVTMAWVTIDSGPGAPDDVPVSLSSWSHDYAFTDQAVRVAFDNFQVNSGTILMSPDCVPEPGSLCFVLTAGLVGYSLVAARRRR